MNTIVVYESQTGFTEQYAGWIAEELGCDSMPLKQASKETLAAYDRVIFGGWVMGNMIMGWGKVQTMSSNIAAVYAVGSTPVSEEVAATIREQNQLKDIPFFYMQGGFRFERLGLLQRLILKTLKKSVSKKENPSPQEEFMAKALGTSFDSSGKEQIKELVYQTITRFPSMN